MDPIVAKRLDALERTVEENNKLLKKMHRAMITGRVIRAIYWVAIIGVALGSLYFLQPYIDLLANSVGQLQGVLELFQSGAAVGTAPAIQ